MALVSTRREISRPQHDPIRGPILLRRRTVGGAAAVTYTVAAISFFHFSGRLIPVEKRIALGRNPRISRQSFDSDGPSLAPFSSFSSLCLPPPPFTLPAPPFTLPSPSGSRRESIDESSSLPRSSSDKLPGPTVRPTDRPAKSHPTGFGNSPTMAPAFAAASHYRSGARGLRHRRRRRRRLGAGLWRRRRGNHRGVAVVVGATLTCDRLCRVRPTVHWRLRSC